MKIAHLFEGRVEKVYIPASPNKPPYTIEDTELRVVINPSNEQVLGLLRRSKSHMLRGFINRTSPKLETFVWSADESRMFHHTIKQALGVNDVATNCDFMLSNGATDSRELDTGTSHWFASEMFDIKVLVGSPAPQFITSPSFNEMFGGFPPRALEQWVHQKHG